jgi:signal transduction histidine kinase
VYIFDGHLVVQIHPNSTLEGNNGSKLIEPTTQKPLLPLLIGVADKNEEIRYLWDKPSDPGKYTYGKVSWVRYFKEFDWYICSSAYLDELGASASTLRNRVLAVFILTLLLSVTLIYLFVKRLTSPLLQMRDTALLVIEGDLYARCKLNRDDEIGTVAMALDNMVERLQGNINNLDTKIAERTIALENANSELKKMDQIKSDFLTTVSHELRTPITTVSGFVKQVKKKLESVVFPKVEEDEKTCRAMSQVRNNLDIVINEGERLAAIINDLLYCATLEAGKVEWDFATVPPERLLARTIAAFTRQAELKGLTLSKQCEADIPEVICDESRIFHVLDNLVGNAIKFTERGSIVLRAFKKDQCIFFSVEDTGRGIAKEDQGSIFGKFIQIGDTLTDKPEGTGLGLSICRQIIQYNGGSIRVESTLDLGSIFYFSLPMASANYHNIQLDI